MAAVLVAAACKPAVHGRCSKSSECREGSYCSTEGVCLPGAGLSLAVFEPPASDAVNGWVPRSGADVDVRVTVETQDGSPPEEATLALDTCPAQAACSYPGTLVSHGASAEFSFQVPRAAQAQGSEAPVAFTVTAKDQAGNQAQATGALQIDDAPPAIGSFVAVSTGVAGEDGNTWFLGGSGANAVEIAVPVADSGAGFAALSLQLDSSDVIAGTTLSVPGTPGGDGTVHFQVPASAVRGKEQRLRFTLTAVDKLQHAISIGPDDPRTQIWVDALAPVIVSALQVDSANASGPGPQCATDSATYKCGRQGGTHLLPDDTATVSFDAVDCGAGLLAAQPDASASTAAGTHGFAVIGTGQAATQCGNGSTNPVHHYAFTLDLKTVLLDPPSTDGTTLVQLAAKALDRLQQGTPASGSAQASVWRWRSQVATNAQPAGSAALLPGTAGSRQIAVGTTLPPTGANLFVVNPDGTPAWSALVSPGIGTDVAAGSSGTLYAISPPGSCGGTTTCVGALNIVPVPTPGAQAKPQSCSVTSVSFGAPPVILASPETAIAASTAHSGLATPNVYFFSSASGACTSNGATVGTGDYAGVSASAPTIFFASGQGFSSEDLSGSTSFNTSSLRTYNAGTVSLTTLAPPSIAAESTTSAIFGTAASDQSVRRTVKASCPGVPCWQTDPAYTPSKANSGLPYTPVFDQSNIYVADDRGTVYAFDRKTGGNARTVDFRGAMPAGWPPATSATISAPVLLNDGSVLEVRSDGLVARASGSGIVPLLMTNPVSTPVPPVIDQRGSGGIAYVSDGAGWLWAVQLATPPATAGASVWPRPGRDSCNSRNAASACP